MKFIDTELLHQAYEEHGPSDGEAVILLHGFPYDPRCYDAVAPVLAERGYRVIVPYLRGYGPTRFLSRDTLRSGQQAALAHDLRALMDALSIQRAAMAGYDWGGQAACITAALWPERVSALVTGEGYNIQNIPASVIPAAPEAEHRLWYQYYFHSPRGEAGLVAGRFNLCRLLWKLWSPTWNFSAEEYARTAASFENPDFVEVVIHSYRHRFAYVAGDPVFDPVEAALERQPAITVPSISLCGEDDGVGPPRALDQSAHRFTGRYERRLLPGVGHNIPQEDPQAVVRALLDLMG